MFIEASEESRNDDKLRQHRAVGEMRLFSPKWSQEQQAATTTVVKSTTAIHFKLHVGSEALTP